MDAEVAPPRPQPLYRRLAFWAVFVGLIGALNYAARFSGARGGSKGVSHQEVYSYATFAGGTVIYAVWLGIVLLICIDRFDLLYRSLWRLVYEPELKNDFRDGDLALAEDPLKQNLLSALEAAL